MMEEGRARVTIQNNSPSLLIQGSSLILSGSLSHRVTAMISEAVSLSVSITCFFIFIPSPQCSLKQLQIPHEKDQGCIKIHAHGMVALGITRHGVSYPVLTATHQSNWKNQHADWNTVQVPFLFFFSPSLSSSSLMLNTQSSN